MTLAVKVVLNPITTNQHLTELKNIYITEIHMKKQYKSSIIKNHKITKKVCFFYCVPFKGYVAS